MEDVKAAHSIEFPSDYVIGKGVLSAPFSLVLWEAQLGKEGKLLQVPSGKKDEKGNDILKPSTIDLTVKNYRKRLTKEQFADTQTARTISFRIDLEGITVAGLIERESSETTLRKQYRNNNWAAGAVPTLEKVEETLEKAGKSRMLLVSWKDCQPSGGTKVDLSQKNAEKLTKEMETMKAKMAKYEAELKRRAQES